MDSRQLCLATRIVRAQLAKGKRLVLVATTFAGTINLRFTAGGATFFHFIAADGAHIRTCGARFQGRIKTTEMPCRAAPVAAQKRATESTYFTFVVVIAFPQWWQRMYPITKLAAARTLASRCHSDVR